MLGRRRAIGLCRTLLLIAGAVPAFGACDAVYKSVDAAGNVTYSAEPPAPGSADKVEELQLLPGPNADDSSSAHQRLRAGERAEQERQNANASNAERKRATISDAQQTLIKAKAALEQAKIQGDEDWQYLATGGRVLSEAYFNRVADAQARVQAAEDNLLVARRLP